MKKILFMIHDLGHGGAEKVLVNLVNNMDHSKFDVTVTALFGGGVNEQFLSPKVKYRACFPREIPGNSHLMKLLSPKQLHSRLVKERYDVEVAYLEGPAARVISGCADESTKTACWIHSTQYSEEIFKIGFRSADEARACYGRFDKMLYVSEGVKSAFESVCPEAKGGQVVYNTNESEKIIALSEESAELLSFDGCVRVCAVGKVVENKGFDRLARVHKRLKDEGIGLHTYILGVGDKQGEIEEYIRENGLCDSFTFLGYQTNPYKYVAKCDVFVCSSFAEGFSTAATEALIVGTPVCTVEVSGMREMLGSNNEYGVICENSEDALYEGLRSLVSSPQRLAHYKEMAALRGKDFSTENTVCAVEEMLLLL